MQRGAAHAFASNLARPLTAVFHSADVLYLFGLPQLAQLNLTSAPGNLAGPLALANAYNFTAADAVLSTQLINYWYVAR